MKKEKIIAFRPPEDLIEWLDSLENKTDIVLSALRLFHESDIKEIYSLAHELGLTPGRLVDVAVEQFKSLSLPDRRKRIADYYGKLEEMARRKHSSENTTSKS
ncbi:MAG: hypothetical protein AB1656_04900 [Candidatus Omnitrophota bacterium]